MNNLTKFGLAILGALALISSAHPVPAQESWGRLDGHESKLGPLVAPCAHLEDCAAKDRSERDYGETVTRRSRTLAALPKLPPPTIDQVKVIVADTLKNPDSAKFGKVWQTPEGFTCGYVNGNNSFGALAGKSGFVVSPSGELGGYAMWNGYCQ